MEKPGSDRGGWWPNRPESFGAWLRRIIADGVAPWRQRRRRRLLPDRGGRGGRPLDFQAGEETLQQDNLGRRGAGDQVNLERSLQSPAIGWAAIS